MGPDVVFREFPSNLVTHTYNRMGEIENYGSSRGEFGHQSLRERRLLVGSILADKRIKSESLRKTSIRKGQLVNVVIVDVSKCDPHCLIPLGLVSNVQSFPLGERN